MPSLSCQMHLSIPSVAVSREYDMKKIDSTIFGIATIIRLFHSCPKSRAELS